MNEAMNAITMGPALSHRITMQTCNYDYESNSFQGQVRLHRDWGQIRLDQDSPTT